MLRMRQIKEQEKKSTEINAKEIQAKHNRIIAIKEKSTLSPVGTTGITGLAFTADPSHVYKYDNEQHVVPITPDNDKKKKSCCVIL
jgi:hypothetical protein